MSSCLEWIENYLVGRNWTSPTQIGNAYKSGFHSAWASPKCKKLVSKGILIRNDKGWYMLSNKLFSLRPYRSKAKTVKIKTNTFECKQCVITSCKYQSTNNDIHPIFCPIAGVAVKYVKTRKAI